ncbi:MAG: transposase [Enterobacterales bacterium]|nr:transposase [Enterobacterales bacterium]
MRAKFSQSFKIQAVEKVLSRSNGTTMSQVANDLQVSLSSLNKWIVQSREQALEPGTEVGLMSQSKEKDLKIGVYKNAFKLSFNVMG